MWNETNCWCWNGLFIVNELLPVIVKVGDEKWS